MKKLFVKITVVIIVMGFLCPTAFALSDSMQENGANSDTARLYESLSDEARELLYELGIEQGGFEEMYTVSLKRVPGLLLKQIKEGAGAKLSVLFSLLGILLVCSSVSVFAEKGGQNAIHFVGYVTACACVGTGLASLMTAAASVTQAAMSLVKLFVPVYAAIIAASGNPALAISYNTAMLGFSGAVLCFSERVFVPVFGMMCALSFVGGMSDALDSGRIIAAMKKWISVGLGLCGTLFSGLLSLKNTLAKSADGLGTRGIRFLIGSGLPVVGGTVSEAYQTIIASLKTVRSTVGVFGIVALAVTFLPLLIELVSWLFVLCVASVFAGMLGSERESALLKNLSCAVSLMLSLSVLIFAVLAVTAGAVLG